MKQVSQDQHASARNVSLLLYEACNNDLTITFERTYVYTPTSLSK